MSGAAVVMMLLIGGFVWGGFLLLLTRAMRSEAGKRDAGGAEGVAAAERIYLTGFMGAGKSAVGRALAAELGWEFLDLDSRVEETVGLAVPEILDRLGEESFRAVELAELTITLRSRRLVVATGGGTLAQPGALELLRGQGLIVWLKLPFAELAARVEAAGAASRPLYGDRRQARRLYQERLPFYRQADLVLAVTGGEGVEGIVCRLAAELGVEECAT